jgi:threonine dehydratase
MRDAAEGGAVALPDLAAIRAAHARIAPHVHRTPVLSCRAIDEETGARLFFKCENFQKVGAFKARGATNAVFSLSDAEARHGVVCHSSGNHGAALAYAARQRGIAAWVVMPENSAKVKQDNVRRFGAAIRFCAPNIPAREALCAEVLAETGATMVHPFDNERVIAGQATAALELLESHPDLDIVVAPVGGGGLLSGTAIAGALAQALDTHLRRGARERRRCGAQLSNRIGRAARSDDDDRRRPPHDAVAAHARGHSRRGCGGRHRRPRRRSCARCG